MPSTTCVISCSRRETSPVRLSQSRMRLLSNRQLLLRGRVQFWLGPTINNQKPCQYQQHNGHNQQAAFGAVGAAAPQRIASGRSVQVVAGGNEAAVRGT